MIEQNLTETRKVLFFNEGKFVKNIGSETCESESCKEVILNKLGYKAISLALKLSPN